MLIITDIFIYPVKSLSGIAVTSSDITDRGLKYDRRWMLVDENMRFISQREHPGLSLLQVALKPNRLHVYHKLNKGNVSTFFSMLLLQELQLQKSGMILARSIL
jgi:uncharacterized protein YcbX